MQGEKRLAALEDPESVFMFQGSFYSSCTLYSSSIHYVVQSSCNITWHLCKVLQCYSCPCDRKLYAEFIAVHDAKLSVKQLKLIVVHDAKLSVKQSS